MLNSRPTRGYFDPIREKFNASITGNIHISVLAECPIQTPETKRLARDGNANVASEPIISICAKYSKT